MLTIDINDAKINLPKYISDMKEGEVLLLYKNSKPVAEVKKVSAKEKTSKRKLGQYKGKVRFDKNFTDPLPDEILKHFT